MTCSAAATAWTYYKVLRILYAWLVEEQEIRYEPMARMIPPIVPEQPPVPVVPDDGLRRLLKACDGRDFEARRDTAIILLLLDIGPRRGGLAGVKLADVDLDLEVITVLGKGRRPRSLPFGHRAGVALDRYLRTRARHRHARLDWLWRGPRGRLTDSGMAQMLRRRGADAGLPTTVLVLDSLSRMPPPTAITIILTVAGMTLGAVVAIVAVLGMVLATVAAIAGSIALTGIGAALNLLAHLRWVAAFGGDPFQPNRGQGTNGTVRPPERSWQIAVRLRRRHPGLGTHGASRN